MQIFVRKPDNRLAAQRFPQRIGAHNVAKTRTDIRQPRLPRFRQFNLQPHCQRNGAVENRAKTQTRIAFGDHFFRRQVSQRIRLFCHRLAAQFAARLRMFIATGQPMNGLRLLLFIVNKQAALLVNKLDAQMAAFQQLPGRGRQATVRREMDLCAFAERMVRS